MGLLTASFITGKTAFAETDPLAQEKIERRLQFNQYYESALLESRRPDIQDESEKPWELTFATSVGYDTNAPLDIPAESDNFFQETADFSWSSPHPGLGGRFPGSYGIRLGADWLTYEDETEADYLTPDAEIWAEFEIISGLTLKESYRFAYLHYPKDEDLRYLSQEISSEITHRVTDRFEHELYFDAELKNFTDRNALDPSNRELSKNRQDVYCETGYRVRFEAGPGVEFGVSGGIKKNMSNDIFEDFNDYRGALVSGYVYYQVRKEIALMFLSGYDYKKFEERHFPGSPRKAERDNFMYFGPSIYWDFARNRQLILSYLFSENYSNDPQQEYIDQIVTATLLIRF